VNAKDSEGKTPLDHALNKPSKIVDFLLKQGGKTAEELKAAGN
jgi:ankyrin repeat protein